MMPFSEDINRMRRLFLLGLVSMVSVVVACGGSSGGSSGGVSTLPDGAVVDPTDGGDAGVCPPAPTQVLEANAGSLDVSGNELVFLDYDAGVAFLTEKTRAVRKVNLDGTGDTVLYTAVAQHQINDVKTVGTTVFFLESEADQFGNQATSLFSMPIAGGAPTLVGKHVDPTVGLDFDRADAIITADADSVFIVRAQPTGEGSLWRFAVAGGAETLVYRGSIKTRPQKVGDEFYFLSASIPSGITNFDSVVKVPAAGGVAPAAVGATKCRGDLTAGTFGLLCAGSSETMTSKKLSRWDLTGNAHSIVFELPEKSSHVVFIGPSDGTSVYVEPNVREGTNASVSRAPLAGGAPTIVACDRQEIRRRNAFVTGGSNGAYVSELDMAMTPTEIVWSETRKPEGGTAKTAIFRTTR
jgi:hypothetical protein